jgi:hypothetical protein
LTQCTEVIGAENGWDDDFFSINQCFDGAKVVFLSRKVKILWKIFQIDSAIFQICAHLKHSHPKKSIINLAFCSLIRTFATGKRVLTMPNRRKISANAFLRNAEDAHKQRDTQRN